MKHYFLLLCAAACLLTATTATSQLAKTWQPYGGPYHKGGNFYDFVQLTDGTLFAASAGSGVYRSTDDGRTWKPADSNLKDRSVSGLAAAPDGTILAVTLANSVFASTDKGVSWQEYPLAASGSFGARNVAVTPQGTWLAATSQGIYRSTNKGASFVASNTGITETSKRARAFAVSGTTMYAAVRDRIYRSNDDGQTWIGGTTTISNGSANQVFDMALGAAGELYVTGLLFDDIVMSADSGNTWTRINYNLPFVPGTNDLHIPLGIATDQQGNLYAGLAEQGVFMLEKGKTQWTEFPHGALTEGAIWSVFASKTGTILAGTEHNMYYKLTSAGWEASAGRQFSNVQNLWKRDINSLFSFANGRLYMGIVPTPVSGSDAMITFMEQNEFGSLYAGNMDTLWKSSDRAESWDVLRYPDSLAGHFDYLDFVAGQGMIAFACNAYAGQFKGKSAVFLSNTDGTTWLTANGLPDEPYSVLAIEIDNSKTLWALTTTGVYSLDNTFGATWNAHNTGLPQNTVATQIVSNDKPFMNDNLFALADGKVYTYDGFSWRELSQLPTGTTIRRLIKGSGNEPFIAAVADDNSLYVLTSSMLHDAIPPFPFREPEITCAALDLMLVASNNTTEPYLGLYVGTAGMGIYYVEQADFGSVGEYRTTGTEVFPDPARERVSVTVEKTRGGLGQLEIFDPLGTSVLRLEKEMFAGEAIIGCDVSALPSGIYGYRLTLPDGVYGGRFAVIR